MATAGAMLLALIAACRPEVPGLPALGARLDGTTVSGVSSGAYMAGQLHLAHNRIITGAAMIAGGPYGCAQSVYTRGIIGPGSALINASRAINGCMANDLAAWGVPNAQQLAGLARGFAQGHPLAQNNLAELYFAGLGVPQDYVRAYMWVNLAAAHMQGEEKKQAEENREDVAQRMTPAQITEAKQLSEQCRSKKFKGC
jgi:TPR repeat protein